MKRRKLLVVGFSILLIAQNSFAQGDGQGRSQSDIDERNRQSEQRQKETPYRVGGLNERGMIPGGNMTPEGIPLSNTSEAERKAEMKAVEKAREMVKVPPFYRENFNALLKRGDAKLARLFRDKNCDRKKSVTIEEFERCADVPPVDGNGSFYSFNWEKNIFARGAAKDKFFPDERFARDIADLRYTDKNKFAVGSYTILGIISDIGEADFESVKLNSPAVRFLADYKPQTKSSDVEREGRLIKKGINSNGFFYSASAPVLINHTYVLRSVSYRPKKDFLFSRRDDLIIAFKLLGQEPDGSVIIAWKKLKKGKSPVFTN